MRAAQALLLLAAAVGAASSAAVVDPVMQHVLRVREFSCSAPQERAVSATEVVNRRLNTNQTLWPSVTVLRRCDAGSGCCLGTPGLTCTAVASQNVTLYFQVVTPPASGSSGSGRREVINVQVEEDTACDCRPRVVQDAH